MGGAPVGMGKNAIASGVFDPADRRRCAPAPKMLLSRILSNPRYVSVHTLSRRAPSTTRPPHQRRAAYLSFVDIVSQKRLEIALLG